MIRRNFSLLFVNAVLCMPHPGLAASAEAAVAASSQPEGWRSSHVQHVCGMPDAKPKEKGSLAVTADGLTFSGPSGSSSIQGLSIIAATVGNERVELWGMKGRLLRMAIPNGGGLAAAGVMHHRVHMLTVEFRDGDGGYHGAVFLLPADEAESALQTLAELPSFHQHQPPAAECRGSAIQPRSVLVAAPIWDNVEVPVAYRALVYERLIDRFRRLEGGVRVYRDGENSVEQGCPQYTVRLSIAGFQQGSQVKRAVMGPVGMFVGTTQITFDAAFTDASGRLDVHQQVKATVRGESESANVTNGIARNLAKRYSSVWKEFEKSNVAGASTVLRKP